MWNARSARTLRVLDAGAAQRACAFLPSPNRLLAAGEDANLRVWELTGTALPGLADDPLRVVTRALAEGTEALGRR